jgi:hypothetical protein
MSGERVIGACSLCGGDVIEHGIQHSVRPMRPTCSGCGAVKARPFIDMSYSEMLAKPRGYQTPRIVTTVLPIGQTGRAFAKRGDA